MGTPTTPPTSKPALLRGTHVPTVSFPAKEAADRHVARAIAETIQNNAAGMPTVLGLTAGSTPAGVYRELVRLHQEEGLSFANVTCFVTAEFWPMTAESIHSRTRFLRESLFDHVDIPAENIHVPPGDASLNDIESACEQYDRAIEAAGGFDFLLLGIGGNGHLAFNEPGGNRNSRTRLAELDPPSRHSLAGDFFGLENVPYHAVTVGMASILSARRVVVLALGEHKAKVVRAAVEREATSDVPASLLQLHHDAQFVLDDAASAKLTAFSAPWLVGRMEWSAREERHAVIWLANHVEKPILKLEESDFIGNRLHQLLRARGPLDDIRQRVFRGMLAGICTEPAGTEPQRVIVFSPHPDDDVISMGGTLITLAEQGHEVHIAYMTSGNIAVFDHDVLRHLEYVRMIHEHLGMESEDVSSRIDQLKRDIAEKSPGDPDSADVLTAKALIRRTEAIAGAATAGVPEQRLHFLDLPFYRTGEIIKKPIGEDDVRGVADLLRSVDPHQIYVAGDLADPHGTHRLCAEAIFRALPAVAAGGVEPVVWLYRGAWQEYEPHEIERAVPLSPEVMLRKRMAIFKHESQKDRALFPGLDEREFWVRAEQRTRNTAREFDRLGLPEFLALEGFVRYRG